jgi:hypothetical protein
MSPSNSDSVGRTAAGDMNSAAVAAETETPAVNVLSTPSSLNARATDRRSSVTGSSSKRPAAVPSSSRKLQPAVKRQKNAFDVLKEGKKKSIPEKGGRGSGAVARLAPATEAPAVWYHDHWVPLLEASDAHLAYLSLSKR